MANIALDPEPAALIAQSLAEISAAMAVLNSTRLTRKAVVTLIAAGCGLPKRDIEIVITHLEDLEKDWLK